MIFLVTTINYADRATLSITGPAMRQEFGFDAIQLGYIFSAFSWAYVMAQVPGGWLLDRFGARRVYAASIFLWSLFTLLQGTIGIWTSAAAALTTLFALRFILGLAESPAFPQTRKSLLAGSRPASAARRRRSSMRRSISPQLCSHR